MVEEYQEHDMPGECLISLSHNLLDVPTENIKQFVAILALKQISVFRITRHYKLVMNGYFLKIVMDWIVMMMKSLIHVSNLMKTVAKESKEMQIVSKFTLVQICLIENVLKPKKIKLQLNKEKNNGNMCG